MDNKYCKFYKWQKNVSYDNGETWYPLNEYAKGDLYESLSSDCDSSTIVYRWVLIDEYVCEEITDKYTYNFSNGGGIVIGCDEGDVSIDGEGYTSHPTYMPSTNYVDAISPKTGSFICLSVTSTTVHNCVSNVPKSYASGFLSLENATIESGVTSIDDSAFLDCWSMTNISMPNTIDTIDEFAFLRCFNLKNVTLSSNLTTLKKGAFMASGLSTITIPSSLKKIGYAKGDDYLIVDNYNPNRSTNTVRYEGVFQSSSLSSITLNEGLEVIGAKTFNNCVNLQELVTPSTLKVLGYDGSHYTLKADNYPFYNSSSIGVLANCISLTSVTLNEGLEAIGNNAFIGCRSLTSVTIPSTVLRMHMSVFLGCKSLQYVISLPLVPPSISSRDANQAHAEPFADTNNCPIYVPDESVNAYKSASIWNEYQRRIKPLSELY